MEKQTQNSNYEDSERNILKKWNNRWQQHLHENRLAALLENEEIQAILGNSNIAYVSYDWGEPSLTLFYQGMVIWARRDMVNFKNPEAFWVFEKKVEDELKGYTKKHLCTITTNHPSFQILESFPWENISAEFNQLEYDENELDWLHQKMNFDIA